MKQTELKVLKNTMVADHVWRMELGGDISAVTAPGQFVNIALPGYFLRRPISVCDVSDGRLILLYKVVGHGTAFMSALPEGTLLDVLAGLGNGFNLSNAGEAPLIIGGGIGSAPMLYLAKALSGMGKKPRVILGFNKRSEIILEAELSGYARDGKVCIATVDGSYGTRGFATDLADLAACSYFYACGPMPMLRTLYRISDGRRGEFSLEERMGCGFGACVGCSEETVWGVRRVCKDGPVFAREELLWQD